MLSFFGEHFFWKLFVGYDKSCIFAVTKKKETIFLEEDPVVQLVRMPPCHGGGRGFESRPDRKDLQFYLQKIDPVVQLVRMPPCHGGGRGFESRPDRKQKCKLLQNPLNLVI